MIEQIYENDVFLSFGWYLQNNTSYLQVRKYDYCSSDFQIYRKTTEWKKSICCFFWSQRRTEGYTNSNGDVHLNADPFKWMIWIYESEMI